jgi:hypothetical protein
MRLQKDRKGAMPVPVATMINGAAGLVGSNSTLPAGPDAKWYRDD